MDDAAKATLLPRPALSLRHPTPKAFGAPLNSGNWLKLQRFMAYYYLEAVLYTYVEAGESFVLSLAVFLTVIESSLNEWICPHHTFVRVELDQSLPRNLALEYSSHECQPSRRSIPSPPQWRKRR